MCTFERKSMPMVAWYMLSNESYMKRVINDVLPTAIESAWSQETSVNGEKCKVHTTLFAQENESVSVS